MCKVWKVIATSWQEAGSVPELGMWTTSGLAAEPRFSAPGLRFCLFGFLKGQPTFHLSISVPLLISCGLVTEILEVPWTNLWAGALVLNKGALGKKPCAHLHPHSTAVGGFRRNHLQQGDQHSAAFSQGELC